MKNENTTSFIIMKMQFSLFGLDGGLVISSVTEGDITAFYQGRLFFIFIFYILLNIT